MQTRYRAAATALLLTATTGLAATAGAAQASGTHHTGAGELETLTVTVKSKAGAVKLSEDKIRPGNTIFKVKNVDGMAARGQLQLLRLTNGYTLGELFQDVGMAFPDQPTPESIAAVNRIDDNVVFYGGMNAPKRAGGPARSWAVKIDKPGPYVMVNTKSGANTILRAKGDKQKRALPSQDGFVNVTTGRNGVGNAFKVGKNNATSGWMSTTNSAHEPHFVDLMQVKKGTTNADISAMFQGGPAPFVKGGGRSSVGLISPGHRYLWTFDLPQGRYAAMCFWPSKEDGVPHAIMGMHKVFNLG